MPGPPPKLLCGVVVSAGKMTRAVKVRTAKQTYNQFLKKVPSTSPNPPPLPGPVQTANVVAVRQHFQTYESHLVSDPNASLRAGDVVKIAAERQISRHIKHVVTEIVAPWGPGIDERPPVLSAEERVRRVREKTERKKERRRERSREGGEDRVEGVVEGTAVAS